MFLTYRMELTGWLKLWIFCLGANNLELWLPGNTGKHGVYCNESPMKLLSIAVIQINFNALWFQSFFQWEQIPFQQVIYWGGHCPLVYHSLPDIGNGEEYLEGKVKLLPTCRNLMGTRGVGPGCRSHDQSHRPDTGDRARVSPGQGGVGQPQQDQQVLQPYQEVTGGEDRSTNPSISILSVLIALCFYIPTLVSSLKNIFSKCRQWPAQRCPNCNNCQKGSALLSIPLGKPQGKA